VYPTDEPEDWKVRVIPNKYPALDPDESVDEWGDELRRECRGVGSHEVIIESADHRVDWTELDVDQLDVVLRAWQDRLREHDRDARLRTAVVFKNRGEPAGSSVEHTHSQLVALPFVPDHLSAKLGGGERYRDRHGECVFCRLAERASEGRRTVVADEQFVVSAPFASRLPFELRILPREHQSQFSEVSASTRRAFADALLDAVDRLERALDAPPYNAVLYTAPLQSGALDHFHWHLELIPALTKVAGFEWGSGSHINPIPPERAAEHLRDIGPRQADS